MVGTSIKQHNETCLYLTAYVTDTCFVAIYCLNQERTLLGDLIKSLDNSRGCTILHLSDNESVLRHLDNPVVSAKWNSHSNLVTKTSKSMRKNVFCAISLIPGQINDSRSLQDFISSTIGIDNHNIVYLSEQKPIRAKLSKIIRPFIWVTISKDKFKVDYILTKSYAYTVVPKHV